jgi:hypothetical protein
MQYPINRGVTCLPLYSGDAHILIPGVIYYHKDIIRFSPISVLKNSPVIKVTIPVAGSSTHRLSIFAKDFLDLKTERVFYCPINRDEALEKWAERVLRHPCPTNTFEQQEWLADQLDFNHRWARTYVLDNGLVSEVTYTPGTGVTWLRSFIHPEVGEMLACKRLQTSRSYWRCNYEGKLLYNRKPPENYGSTARTWFREGQCKYSYGYNEVFIYGTEEEAKGLASDIANMPKA